MENFLDVYEAYNSDVLYYISVLEAKYGAPLIAGLQDKKIPRRGHIKQIEFFFHGIGCRVVDGKKWVDWDFPLIDNKVGIDPWKLWCYTSEDPKRFGIYSELEQIRASVAEWVKQGILTQAKHGSNQYIFDV